MLYTELRAFHAVAERGSFTRAADRLKVSQPTVSEQVKTLEARYQVRLFERRARRVNLTDTGRRLHSVTTRLFHSETEAEQVLTSARELAQGRLRVGADSPFLIVPMLGRFKRLHPGIQVSIALGNSTALLDDLLARRVDVAVLPDIRSDTRLHAQPLRNDQIVAIVPREHRWAERQELRIDELTAAPLVLRETGSRTRAAFEQAVAEAGAMITELLEIGSREAVREAVAAGLGIGIIAQSEVGSDPRLASVAIAGAALRVVEYAACMQERRNVHVIEAFLDLLRGSAMNSRIGSQSER